MVATAKNYKKAGNEAISRGNYDLAFDLYTAGLTLCGDADEALEKDLFRNRALTCLHRGQYELAFFDSKKTVITTANMNQPQIKYLNAKALLRAGSAEYNLRSFAFAAELFRFAARLNPSDEATKCAVERVSARLSEENHSTYNFNQIQKQLQGGRSRIDCADYLSRVEARQITDRGRGLFALQDIVAGDLVLCEKAFHAALHNDDSVVKAIRGCTSSGQVIGKTNQVLLKTLIKKLSNNPKAAFPYFILHGGINENMTPSLANEQGYADLVTRIFVNNQYKIQSTTKADPMGKDYSVGVWLAISFINHDCLGNVALSFLGDLMILRATRNIAKDDEILVPYIAPNHRKWGSHKPHDKWGFICTCLICKAEDASTVFEREQRKVLDEQIEAFLRKYPISMKNLMDKNSVAQSQKLYARMKKAYDAELFRDVPRVGLLAIGARLLMGYQNSSTSDLTLKFGRILLKEMGITIKRDSANVLQCERKGGSFAEAYIVASALAEVYDRQASSPDNLEEGRFYKMLAEQLLLEVKGDSLGLD